MLPPRQCMRKARILRLENLESRLFLSANPVAELSLDYSLETTAYQIQGTASLSQRIGLDQVKAEYGFSGSGQTVAVIDSGIAYDHLALGHGYGVGYRVVGGYDFTAERDSDPYDDGPRGSHGTHVAGIIASNDSRAAGIAPNADIVALRVFDDQGFGQFSWVEEALAWVHTHRNSFANPITTVNLSLGTPLNAESVPDWAMLEDEFAQLESDGIFISVAAGNGFAAYQRPGLNYPAVSPHVVPVASVDANGSLSSFSQRDDRVIAAPGRSILGTVPDYAGNHNGMGDDFASYSGTSMAAPMVAGASMLLRQAYEFVGVNNVSEQMLYSTMLATADMVYDPVTASSYHRLNLDRAIDSVMPADDFGSTAATADNLGTVADTLSLSGVIAQLGDRDWFSFTAVASGKISISTTASGDFSQQWEFASSPANMVGNGNTLSFTVVAGQTYAVGLSTSNGLGRYRLDMRLEPSPVPPSAPKLVSQVGQQIRVSGTAGNDNFTLTVADAHRLSVNGVDYQFDRRSVGSFVFDGGAGQDTIVIQTGAGDAIASLQPGLADLTGPGYNLHAGNVERITVRAGSTLSRVVFYDSPGNDTFTATPTAAELSGPGFVNRAEGFASACASAGRGFDVAWLYDSPGNDALSVAPTDTTFSGRGFSNRARFFDDIHTTAAAGGYDTAILYDSASNMQLSAAGKTAEASFGQATANSTSAPATKTSLVGYKRIRAMSYGGNAARTKLAAIDFVLEWINLRA